MTVRASPAPAVVVTADLELLDHVLAVSAAAGVEPHVVTDAGALRPLWTPACTVIVGIDQAARVAELVLPRRPEVFVVGEETDHDQVCAWSLPLNAAVVLLPGGANRLTNALADATGPGRGQGRVVAVVGGSGGAGASTCAAALAVVSAQRGLATLLVDGDPLSGGIDLLLAAERVPGWRWPRLSAARGHLGNLTGQLPQVDGVDVLSMDRSSREAADKPDAEQMKSVLLSATRSHQLVVVDLPRQPTSAAREALRRADTVLLIALAQLRGVAAAQQMVAELEEACTALHLLVRLTRPRSLSADAVADGLGLPLLATVADETNVALESARGVAPGRSGRSPLGRSCRTVLDELALTGAVT
ncbi:MAG TPA: septum site-determining protein Ssd [Propionibacteriaceae bacterium]|nr:septum site-determining protein Ssd [Propionibacteriaceae bacterium]